MKNAIILHGTGSTNKDYWFPSVKKTLEKHGYQVLLPQLPYAEEPNLKDWVPFVLDQAELGNETILIGHSAGAQLILSLLEQTNVHIKQAVLVSSYARPLRSNRETEEIGALHWESIRGKSKQIVFINSDNDPWGCDDTQGKILLENLGGVLVIPHGEGHMGSTTYKQPYREFPLLVKLLDI